MTSIFRPRQVAVQRLTPNAGNRRFVRGGAAIMRVTPSADQGELDLAIAAGPMATGKPAVKPPEKVKQRLEEVKAAVKANKSTRSKG
jgi:hypothetical protein